MHICYGAQFFSVRMTVPRTRLDMHISVGKHEQYHKEMVKHTSLYTSIQNSSISIQPRVAG